MMNKVWFNEMVEALSRFMKGVAKVHGWNYSDYELDGVDWSTISTDSWSLDYRVVRGDAGALVLKWIASDAFRFVHEYGTETVKLAADIVTAIFDHAEGAAEDVEEYDEAEPPYFEEYDGPVDVRVVQDDFNR